MPSTARVMTPAPDRLPSGWTIGPLVPADCDELGQVHMDVWRDAYAGVMPADYLAGLSSERSAARWRERPIRRVGGWTATTIVGRLSWIRRARRLFMGVSRVLTGRGCRAGQGLPPSRTLC